MHCCLLLLLFNFPHGTNIVNKKNIYACDIGELVILDPTGGATVSLGPSFPRGQVHVLAPKKSLKK